MKLLRGFLEMLSYRRYCNFGGGLADADALSQMRAHLWWMNSCNEHRSKTATDNNEDSISDNPKAHKSSKLWLFPTANMCLRLA